MNLAVIQIQAHIKQAQYQYVIAFAMKIGRPLAGTDKLITNCKFFDFILMINLKDLRFSASSSSDSTSFPGFTSFEPPAKRVRQSFSSILKTKHFVLHIET